MMKASAIAPTNIAFIKYWGRKDEMLRLPLNGSLSMNLSGLTTTTTVEFDPQFSQDMVLIDGLAVEKETQRVSNHLDRIRKRANIKTKAKVVSQNSFPSGTGLSSSASGFAALTVAATRALGLQISEKELSILARQGSGSACRSIPDGFVEWLDGDTSETSYAVSVFPPNHWDLVDIVAVVSNEKKDISTSEGMQRTATSIFLETRLKHIKNKLQTAKRLLKEKNFEQFGELVESEALEMHAVMMSSKPPLIYLSAEALIVMKSVLRWREEIPVYFTVNTGQDIHLLTLFKYKDQVETKLKALGVVKQIIVSNPAVGTQLTDKHLF